MNKLITTVSIALLAAGCSSIQKAEKIETKMDVKGSVMNEKIGLDKDGQAIVQKQTGADQELRTQRWKNSETENSLRNEHELLEICRRDIADPRLGGSGEVTDIPEVDKLADFSKVKEEFGIAEDGSLQVVKKTLYTDALTAERKYGEALADQVKIVGKHRTSCERKMGYVRAKAGLQSTRYMRNEELGHEYETNLDVAFRNAGKDRARAKADRSPVSE